MYYQNQPGEEIENRIMNPETVETDTMLQNNTHNVSQDPEEMLKGQSEYPLNETQSNNVYIQMGSNPECSPDTWHSHPEDQSNHKICMNDFA